MDQTKQLYTLTCRCGRTTQVADKTITVKCKCRKTMKYLDDMHPLTIWRFKKDFTQGELASLIECNRVTLNNIENYKVNPTDEQKARIRLITGIKL